MSRQAQQGAVGRSVSKLGSGSIRKKKPVGLKQLRKVPQREQGLGRTRSDKSEVGSDRSRCLSSRVLCLRSVSSTHVYYSVPHKWLSKRQHLQEAIRQGRESTPSSWVTAPCCCLHGAALRSGTEHAFILRPSSLAPAPPGISLGSL